VAEFNTSDLLALLHRGGRSLRTVVLTANARSDHEALMRAMERRSERREGVVMRLYARGPAVERPRFVEETTRLWLERPDKLREEKSGEFPRFGVRVGHTWWLFTEQQGAMTNNGSPNHQAGLGQEFELMLEPAQILPLFDFEILGQVSQASRPALRVRGVQRPPSGFSSFLPGPIPEGCDGYEFVVDIATGALLRVVGLIDGEPAVDLQITEIVFDEPIAPERFVFEAPAGEEIEDTSQREPLLSLPIETVAQRVSFTVFVATGLEESWQMHALHMPARRGQPYEQVHLSYHGQEVVKSFAIRQRSADAPDFFATAGGAEEIEHNGIGMQLIRPTKLLPLASVQLERGETTIEVSSDNLAIERLVDIATSLRPIAT